jgi:hypothetical protein
VLVRFLALGGASFVVLVECKHQARPVEREDVRVLEARLRDVNAQEERPLATVTCRDCTGEPRRIDACNGECALNGVGGIGA